MKPAWSRRALYFCLGVVALLGSGALICYMRHILSRNKTSPTRHTNHGVQHIGIIMDGNRRWAKTRGYYSWQGHKAGVAPIKEAVRFCRNHNIGYMTLYAFSLENFKRSQDELNHMFTTIENGLSDDDIAELKSNGVKIRICGDTSRFPQRTRESLARIEDQTREGKHLTVQLLFCYGGRQEILAAARKLARDALQETLSPDEITEETLASRLWTGHIPDPDIIIRTGGKRRLSNFLCWHSAYSELIFLETYWPDITQRELEKALTIYAQRTRNFGA